MTARGPGADLVASFPDRVSAACGLGLVELRQRVAACLQGRGADRDGLAVYRYLSYHLGLTDLAGHPSPEAGLGKGIRPMVCLCAATAVGGKAADALDVAAAIELTHEFSLIHDDIQDGDRLRRGRPTLWAEVGIAQAINAGDALFAIARSLLSAADPPFGASTALAICALYDEACLRLAEGQQQDIAFEAGAPVSEPAYLQMVRDKTGAILGAAAALGALAGGAARDTAARLAAYGDALGVAFQIQDDVLGLWGDPRLTGKPAGNDLRRRKRSLPILRGLAHPSLGPVLAERLARPDAWDDRDTEGWLGRLEDAGCRAEAESAAKERAVEAERLLAEAGLDLASAAGRLLVGLTRAAVERDR